MAALMFNTKFANATGDPVVSVPVPEPTPEVTVATNAAAAKKHTIHLLIALAIVGGGVWWIWGKKK